MIGPAAEVISEYQGTSHDATRIEGEQGARWGSGEGQIVHVTLLDGQGQTESVMSTFEPMTIKVELTAHTPLQDVVVGIGIDSLAGTHVWSSNTKRNGQLIGRLDGPATVELTIPSLPLLEGVYDLTVTLTDHTEVHPYDYWDKRVRFEVRQYRAVRRRRRAHPGRLVGDRRQGDAAEQHLTARPPVTAQTTPFVRVVVINFDGWQMTIDCLESVLATDWPADRLEVVMVDNGSLDDVVDRVRVELPQVRIVEPLANTGFAGGCNLGITAPGEFDYVALVNNDATVDPGWLRPLVDAFARHERVGAVSPKMLFEGRYVEAELDVPGAAPIDPDPRTLGIRLIGARIDGARDDAAADLRRGVVRAGAAVAPGR